MLFELRDQVPEVSSRWTSVRDLFLAGRSRDAWAAATELRKQPGLESANDYLLNIEVARACGAHRLYLALVRMAHAAFPDDLYTQLYHARALLTRGLHKRGIEFLEAREQTLGRTHPTLWATQLANVYADAGFELTARNRLATVADLPDFDSSLSLYTRSCAFEGSRQWEEATQLARACIAASPHWTRARSLLVHCLLTQGYVDQAREEIAAAQQLGHEDSSIEMIGGMLAFSLGRFDEARCIFEQFLERWPQCDNLDWARRTLCVLLVELGRCDEARQVAAGREERLGLPAITDEAAGSGHTFIPLPLVAQNKKQCVPTTVAMAAWPQGQWLEPNHLYQEMHGREGTQLWRMRRWVETHDFRLIPVRLEQEVVIDLLERGIPLIGAIEGPFNSHVDVVCGYHLGLEVFYVRDPMHWAPIAYPYELALKRYEMHGALMAVIEKENTEAIAAAERYLSPQCNAMFELAQAVAEGDRLAAEQAYARIPDDSNMAFLRDGFAVAVVLSPGEMHDKMQKLAADEQANGVARFRALLGLNPADALKVLEQLLENERDKLGVGGRRYLTMLQCMHDGRWREAGALIDRLLERGCGIGEFWELKSDILAELGDQPGSIEALDRAIELEPRRMTLREKALNRNVDRLTFQEYLDVLEALLKNDPEDKRLLWGRATALLDGPDGKAYEASVREHLRWYPRDPKGYLALLQWYSAQGRSDLTDAVLAEAHELLPDVFKAPQQSPAEGPSKGDGAAAQTATQNDAPTAAASTADPPTAEPPKADAVTAEKQPGAAPNEATAQSPELPEESQELLDIVWSGGDPRRPAAQARLIELEQQGQLQWFERANLLANRLIAGPDNTEPPEAEFEALLARPIAGAAHWYVTVTTDQVTNHNPSIRLALAINAWLERHVPDFRHYVGLWFNRVLLLEKARRMEQALAELQSLLEKYPAYSSALYRMGVVKYEQQEYRTAVEYFEKALQVNPGLVGAMQVEQTIFDLLGEKDRSLECVRMQRRKFPYDFQFLRDEVLLAAELESPAAAEQLLRSDGPAYPSRRCEVLAARLQVNQGRLDQAERALAQINDAQDDEALYEELLQGRLTIALERDDVAAILAVCDEGLARWPDSTRLKEIKAEFIARSDPHESRRLLDEVLLSGEARPQTALQYLQLAEQPPDQAAEALVEQAEPDRREALVELFSPVFGHPAFLHRCAAFHEWALQQYDDLDLIRWRLALHYNVSGQYDRAVALAEELHRRNPDNPESLRTLGRVLIDTDPRRALNCLEQVCEQNRSVDYLFDLARCYQINGRADSARQTHWEILQQNPYQAASLTNLYLTGEPPQRLWRYIPAMLAAECGVDDEYFLVAVVKIALDMKHRVPPAWFPLAVERLQILQTHPGFDDEPVQLRRAVRAWLAVRPQDRRPDVPISNGFFASVASWFTWPGRAWVARG